MSAPASPVSAARPGHVVSEKWARSIAVMPQDSVGLLAAGQSVVLGDRLLHVRELRDAVPVDEPDRGSNYGLGHLRMPPENILHMRNSAVR